MAKGITWKTRVSGSCRRRFEPVKRLRLPTDACRVTDNKCTTTSCSDKGKCNNMKINDLYVPPPKRTEEIASTTTKAQETLTVNAKIMLYDTRQHHYIKALIDSGCTTSAINKEFVEKNRIVRKRYPRS